MRRVISLVPPEYRRGCLRVALLVPVKAILDLVGVAALLPVMMLVLDPEKLQTSFLGKVSRTLDFATEERFAAFVIVAVVLVLLVKIALSLLIINYQNRYLLSLYRNLSSRLFVSLYSRGLLYIKNQNSSRMTFNVIGVCYNFVMGYLGGWMGLAGEAALVLLLLAALMIYSPVATSMAVCAFVPVVVLYLLLIRKPLREMNRKENDMRREQHKLLNEAFKGYSEVQVNDAFPQIQRRFADGLDGISRYRIRSGIIQSIPSYLLELSVVMIVAAMMVFSFTEAGAGMDIIFLGVFTVALLKLMPAVKGIISSMSAISATQYTCEVISDINTPAVYNLLHDDVAPMSFEREIEVRDLSFRYPDEDGDELFKDLSFTIRKGRRYGIMGRTGAGKTTLFNILLGLYTPDSGSVLVDGVPLSVDNVASWHRIVGYVPQDVFVADGTILENVSLGIPADQVDRDRAVEALRQASLGDFVNGLAQGVDSKIGEGGCKLSGGQKQRLGIARALYKNAKVLFFDEATSALDNRTESEVNEAIAHLSDSDSTLTIIVISHRDTTLSFCDEILQI